MRLLCIKHNIHLWLCHIAGKDNIVPDALSRYALAPRTESWSLIQDKWGAIERRYGLFDLGTFSYVNCVNRRAPEFCSVINQPFDLQFDGLRVWAFQPLSLASRFLVQAQGWRASVLVALVPAADFRAQADSTWQALRFFESCSRIFTRWHWGRRCRCKSSGLEWVLIHLMPDVGGGSTRSSS